VNAIETERLTKRFRRVNNYLDLALYPWRRPAEPAVEEISFEVREGELFGLLGENGAGKTTLIRMLSTALLPTSGRASVRGHDVTRHPHEVRRVIGLVSGDERSFYWRLTGRQNLQYFAALYHVPRHHVAERIEELLGVLSIREYADRRFDGYSTGIRQKFAIARGMLTEPSVLFLDEPTRALDPIAADELRKHVAEHIVGDLGRTVVLATHTLTEAEAICDRVAILRRGHMVEIGTMDELRHRIGLSTVLELTVSGEPTPIRNAVARVDGVASVSDAVNDDASTQLTVSLSDVDGATDEVIRVVHATGSVIRAITTRRPTLDDIYRAAHAEA
jgi:ABC-2 type transport system ATP-binding protein